MSKNEENWLARSAMPLAKNYEALKAHVLETCPSPNKHYKRLNWTKYNAKLVKQGKLSPELEEMRSGCHTGGRRKAALR